jgi:excinuclease ABC subunit A
MLKRLRDLGNTIIVVEHDMDTMLSADYIIDMGPGAGVHGGEIVAAGTPKEIINNNSSLTGQYLAGKKQIDVRCA